jgi:arsenate reductase
MVPGAAARGERSGQAGEPGYDVIVTLLAMPAPAGPTVQLFGLADSRPTQAALRFFKERRVNATFVDLRRKPIAAGELRRFVERLGAPALLDADGRRYKELGLGYMRLDADEIVERLLADNGLLRLPLARCGDAFTAGPAEATWKGWLAGPAK